MNPEPINVLLLALVIVIAGGAACLWYSPDALYSLGRKFCARSRGLRAAKAAFEVEYQRSLDEDRRAAEGRHLLAELERSQEVEENG